MKRKYKDINFSPERAKLIAQAIRLVADYRAQGYSLTLRQLYYQFVARDAFPESWADPSTGSTNNEPSYKKLGDIIADARLAGLLDWNAIEDRTREIDGNSHWDNPKDIVEICSRQFAIDKWANQEYRVEVWVEKDALEGVVGRVAREMDVQFFSCRGYASMTSIWDAGQRLKSYAAKGQTPVILHLGDHDPSGIDMSRDIKERVEMFMDAEGGQLEFRRIALSMAQVKQYTPPPNPAKVTDSRFKGYVRQYGDECWELDALDPSVLDALIRGQVADFLDEALFDAKLEDETAHKQDLAKAARHWNGEIKEVLATLDSEGK